MKCKYCGKEYIKNPAILPDWMPLSMKEQIKFIPACDCLEKQKIRELLLQLLHPISTECSK